MAALPTPKWKLEDGFTPHWTPAPALARWPPLAWRAKHRVRLGQNWLSIAHDNLVPDVWDLIWFNFATDDPRKVNWYLRHYVGCWAAAADWKNFAFTDHDEPGVVYIPPHGYARRTGLPFPALVLSQLEKSVQHFPDLILKDFHIDPIGLGKVLQAMRLGRMAAVHVPGLETPAEYRPGSKDKPGPAIALRSAHLASWLSRTLLVHEAVHAIVHRNSFREIKVWQNEFLAYAVEALWGRAVDDTMAEAMVSQDLHDTDITHNAYVLAHYLRAKGKWYYGQFIMRVKDVDAMLPDYRDKSRSLNPFENMKEAIKREYRNSWNRPETFTWK
jgi:hypothetical protein